MLKKLVSTLWYLSKPLRAILLGLFLGLSGIGVYYGMREFQSASTEEEVDRMLTFPYYFFAPLLIIGMSYVTILTYITYRPLLAIFSNEPFHEVFFPKGEVTGNVPYPYLHAFIQGAAVLCSPLMSFFCLMMLGSFATTLGVVAPFGFPLIEKIGYLLLDITVTNSINSGIGGGIAGTIAMVTAFTCVTLVSGMAAWFFPREQTLPEIKKEKTPLPPPLQEETRSYKKPLSYLDAVSSADTVPEQTGSRRKKKVII
jgi:hypothetical protein